MNKSKNHYSIVCEKCKYFVNLGIITYASNGRLDFSVDKFEDFLSKHIEHNSLNIVLTPQLGLPEEYIDQYDPRLVETIEKQAKLIAKSHRDSDPYVKKVLWFPSHHEIRLVDVDSISPIILDYRQIPLPFNYHPSNQNEIYYPSSIVVINEKDYLKCKLPVGWGSWEDAVEV